MLNGLGSMHGRTEYSDRFLVPHGELEMVDDGPKDNLVACQTHCPGQDRHLLDK